MEGEETSRKRRERIGAIFVIGGPAAFVQLQRPWRFADDGTALFVTLVLLLAVTSLALFGAAGGATRSPRFIIVMLAALEAGPGRVGRRLLRERGHGPFP